MRCAWDTPRKKDKAEKPKRVFPSQNSTGLAEGVALKGVVVGTGAGVVGVVVR